MKKENKYLEENCLIFDEAKTFDIKDQIRLCKAQKIFLKRLKKYPDKRIIIAHADYHRNFFLDYYKKYKNHFNPQLNNN